MISWSFSGIKRRENKFLFFIHIYLLTHLITAYTPQRTAASAHWLDLQKHQGQVCTGKKCVWKTLGYKLSAERVLILKFLGHSLSSARAEPRRGQDVRTEAQTWGSSAPSSCLQHQQKQEHRRRHMIGHFLYFPYAIFSISNNNCIFTCEQLRSLYLGSL